MVKLKTGLNNIIDSIKNHKLAITRFFYLIGYCILLYGLSFQFNRFYIKLKIRPEIFTNFISVNGRDIPFPALTICPPYFKAGYSKDEFLRNYSLTHEQIVAIKDLINPKVEDYMKLSTNHSYPNKSMVDILELLSPTIDDLFYYCALNNGPDGCNALLTRSLTVFGICHTFNMLQYESLFNDLLTKEFDIYKSSVKSQQNSTWTLENGYVSDEQNVYPVRASVFQNVAFNFKVPNIKDYITSDWRDVQIILHLPNEIAAPFHTRISIRETEATIQGLSAEIKHVDRSLQSFSPAQRGCYFDGEKPLKYFKSYTKSNCELECLINITMSFCNCAHYLMPRTDDLKVCIPVVNTCPKIFQYEWPLNYYTFYETVYKTNKKPDFPCGCLSSCTEITYKLKQVKKADLQKDTDNRTIVSLLFADSQIISTTSYVTYQLENFIFDVGGLFGLCLGSSLLSLLTVPVRIYSILKDLKEKFDQRSKQRLETNQRVNLGNESVADVNIKTSQIQSNHNSGDKYKDEEQDLALSETSRNVFFLHHNQAPYNTVYRNNY